MNYGYKDKCDTSKLIWSVKIAHVWKYLFGIEMDKYVPLHALHLSISWPAHLHMYLCRFLRGLSHTAGVSECHGFSLWICASLCLILLGMSMCVCKCDRGYVALFFQSICFLHLSVDVSFSHSSLCLCICVPYHVSDPTKWATTSRWCSVVCLVSEYLSHIRPINIASECRKRRLYIHRHLWIVSVFPHLCLYETWFIFIKVWVKLAKAIHVKMGVAQMCSPRPLTSSSILKSSGNSHYSGEIVWPFTALWQKCNYRITFDWNHWDKKQPCPWFVEFCSWRHIHTSLDLRAYVKVHSKDKKKKTCCNWLTLKPFCNWMTCFFP